MNKVVAPGVSESTCHEGTLKYKIQSDKEDIVIEKEELVVKKDMTDKKIMRKNINTS